jgi:hypothetical protein
MRLITRPLARLSALTLVGFALVAGLLGDSAAWLRTRAVRDQAGNVITDNLAWIVFGVVAIVVIGGLLETLGRSVVSWVTAQLGL